MYIAQPALKISWYCACHNALSRGYGWSAGQCCTEKDSYIGVEQISSKELACVHKVAALVSDCLVCAGLIVVRHKSLQRTVTMLPKMPFWCFVLLDLQLLRFSKKRPLFDWLVYQACMYVAASRVRLVWRKSVDGQHQNVAIAELALQASAACSQKCHKHISKQQRVTWTWVKEAVLCI